MYNLSQKIADAKEMRKAAEAHASTLYEQKKQLEIEHRKLTDAIIRFDKTIDYLEQMSREETKDK